MIAARRFLARCYWAPLRIIVAFGSWARTAPDKLRERESP